MVHAIGYYTGMIFRGISPFFGQPLISGGRYDGLLAEFGRPLGAVGFAMGIEHVLEALDRQGAKPESAALDVLLVLGNSAMDKAWKKADELRSTGKSVELCYESDPQSIRALAQARRAKQVMEV